MRKTLLFTAISMVALSMNAQTQLGNSDMELWENVGGPTEEPTNWNGIKTASGNSTLIGFAPQAITQSADTRTGSGFSAKLVSNSVLGTIANGTMTIGQLNVGSVTATDPSNFAWSNTADSDFSEAMTDMPDSIVWWAKYTPVTGISTARMKATLHDSYDYQDPEDVTSATHVVAQAELNYSTTTGVWVRFSKPFIYSGPASGNTHILITFTSNNTPGGGDGGDEVLIDDVELIYNPAGIKTNSNELGEVYLNNENATINFSTDKIGSYEVYTVSGTKIKSGEIENTVSFNETSGIYIVIVKVGEVTSSFKVYKN